MYVNAPLNKSPPFLSFPFLLFTYFYRISTARRSDMGQKEAKGEKKAVDGGQKKKEEGSSVVIYKVDIHCEGCASKIKRCVRRFQGVEGVTADKASNQLTVTGNVDPWLLRDHVEAKINKKVEIVSPVKPPKKEADGGDKKPGPATAVTGGDSKDQKKSKELAASTVVLQIRLHCDGCIQRIKKSILKVKGVQEVSVDAQKDLVTVKGTMDVNSLPTYLKDKLKRGVEIVSAKNDGGNKKEKAVEEKTNKKESGGGGGDGGGGGGGGEKKEEGGGGEKKEKKEEGGGGEKKKEKESGGGEKKGEGGNGGGQKDEVAKMVAAEVMAVPAMVETNRMDYHGSYGYNMEMVHAPQLFSDENPNACLIM